MLSVQRAVIPHFTSVAVGESLVPPGFEPKRSCNSIWLTFSTPTLGIALVRTRQTKGSADGRRACTRGYMLKTY